MKLISLNIIKDDMVGKREEEFRKMITAFNEEVEFAPGTIMEAISTFIAKLYVNYHFEEILKSHSVDVNDVYRFLQGKPREFLHDVGYNIPIFNEEANERTLKAAKEKVLELVKTFHHDYIYPDDMAVVDEKLRMFKIISRENALKIVEGQDAGRYIKIYNRVVLGSKLYFANEG